MYILSLLEYWLTLIAFKLGCCCLWLEWARKNSGSRLARKRHSTVLYCAGWRNLCSLTATEIQQGESRAPQGIVETLLQHCHQSSWALCTSKAPVFKYMHFFSHTLSPIKEKHPNVGQMCQLCRYLALTYMSERVKQFACLIRKENPLRKTS